ncbi:IPT/TIG domain-containing protein [Povalibacter sp.]|uniref:IPT/TIG domain-containing protein n=1 Tax=Povalibacter sp. TaxID=1962978 RepID=UPI002F3EEA56
MHHLTGARRVAGVALLLSLCACSGSSDDNETSRQIELSTHSLTFSAAAPTAATPAAQTITASFSAGIANLSVVHTGQGIAKVTTAVNGTTAQIVVTPSDPATIGAGRFTGTLAVTGYFCADTACSRLEAGGSQTVTAKYQISPVVDYVAPNVATAGVSGTAVIRGSGFNGYAIQSVKFGDVAATSLTVVNGSEIRAAYPALPAGSYAVSLGIPTHEGTPPSTATLIAVDAVTRTAQTLPWPAAVTAVTSLRHDAQRDALLVSTDIADGTVVRYAHAGGAWEPATTTAIAGVRDIALSTDGAQLLALSRTGLTPLDPVTLAPATTIAAPSLPEKSFLKTLAVANNNLAIVTTGIAESKATELYTYIVRTGVMTKLPTALNNASMGSSTNGALIGIIQGDSTLTTAPAAYTYAAASGTFSPLGVALNQNSVAPVLDRDATRLVLNGVNVYGADFALLGKLPETTLAVSLRPDGKRAYTYDSAAAGILTFDISATKNGAAFTALGAATPLAAAPGASAKMTISADGKTLFIAGTTQIVVLPAPLDP